MKYTVLKRATEVSSYQWKKMQCHSYNSPPLVDITEVLSITEVDQLERTT